MSDLERLITMIFGSPDIGDELGYVYDVPLRVRFRQSNFIPSYRLYIKGEKSYQSEAAIFICKTAINQGILKPREEFL